ncbi:MAG: DUF3793 family protein [Lachnospiraceae bacterium]
MSTETLHLLSDQQKTMPEFHLVDCCAPTLAGMKAGSIFNVSFADEKTLHAWVRGLNQNLCFAGLVLVPLKEKEGNALILLFRISQLGTILEEEKVREFLSRDGYPGGGVFADLAHLRARMAQVTGEFPHEIGIFLGYPLCDVVGFIEHQGRDCKLCGTWKVYGDEQAAAACFARYERCRETYWRLWITGKRTIPELAVAG